MEDMLIATPLQQVRDIPAERPASWTPGIRTPRDPMPRVAS
jgi:hypothetical protein